MRSGGRCLLLVAVVGFCALFVQHAEGQGTGLLTWGQTCSPSASLTADQYHRCDTSKRLSCGGTLRLCRCHHEERDFYNADTDQCETKIGKFCSASETFPTICAKNAVCDAKSNFCVCPGTSVANEAGTECVKEAGDEEENGANGYKPGKVQVALSILAVVLGSRLF